MPKDLKIGLAVGLGFVIVAVLWLATRPSLTPEARLASAPLRRARIQSPHSADVLTETGIQTDSRYTMNENPEARINKPESSTQKPVARIEKPESSIQNEPIELIKTERFYIVRKNDTLSSISKKYYGTATKWPKIFDANRKSVPNADRLPIGVKLIIPD